MSETLGILFLHHDAGEVAATNLHSVKIQNPNATIVTISAGEPFPNGYRLAATPDLQQMHALNPTRSSDVLVCSWFRQKQEICDRWWIIEWDTYCTESVLRYYEPAWGMPFVAAYVVRLDREPEWRWFRGLFELPHSHHRHAMGAVPFLYLVSDNALSNICTELLQTATTAGNGELRFATAGNRCGFPPCEYRPPNNRIGWEKWNRLDDVKAIFHSVKHCVKSPGNDLADSG